MRRTIIILLVIAVVAAGGYWLWSQRQAQQEVVFEVLREETVKRGEITATVNATGSIEPEALVSLTFGIAGTVQQVNIVRGLEVQAGDILATLNTEELALAVQQAQDALEIQQLTLEQRRNLAPSEATLAAAQADIAAAEANLAVAQGNLAAANAAVQQAVAVKNQLLAGATVAELSAAQADLAAAQAEQKRWQDQYDRILQGELLGWPEEETRFALNAANQAVTAAQARIDVLNAGPSAADISVTDAGISAAQAQVQAAQGSIAVAQANISRSQAAYDKLLEPASAEELAILEAQVKSAETNLALTQLRFDQSQIVAPISGKVATVLINVGEQVVPGAPVVTIVNEGAFHITVNVDEIDIDQIQINQPVEITLDALSNTPVSGVISEVAPTPETAGGVVTYLVTINITEVENISLRPGMSANASIVVDKVEDVLMVPNWAIRLNRETGEAYVNIQKGINLFEEVKVETGLRNEQFSEVVSGLSEGDVVVVTNARETFSIFGGTN